MRRFPLAFMILFLGLGLVFLAGPRLDLAPYTPRPLTLDDDLDSYLQRTEREISGIAPDAEKTIAWAHPDRRVTPWAIVYIHGFTANRHETDPVVANVGRALGANVFYARLAGHGLMGPDAIGKATVHEWFHDAEEALAIARRIGERVAVVGMSTGGTLALWLAAHHAGVNALTLISPNFGPARKTAELILLPWGPKLAEWTVGPYMSWGNAAENVPPYFTTRFATQALFPMMALVSATRSLDLQHLQVPTLTLYSPNDTVVDPRLIERYARKLPHPRNEVLAFPNASHILAGRYGETENTDAVTTAITDFIRKE